LKEVDAYSFELLFVRSARRTAAFKENDESDVIGGP
jgi:hypothetical protein